ncbi:hypothetical protein CNEO3_420003 [Clostridium neonatale]|nr:hypothetical protein CNEO_2660003 [Clostridium neonatale]CAI3544740.1 hypothetical protein CNEO3_270003 [Clostridium neonatale]CAI3563276.1 hypothetical protein CNEO4_130005 [Clostridium neonatale]CAI3601783.1 hypothetical protein CNEO3_320003 [Clostridium neonatale]CAI3630436.1 hypothetical protein CNEO3_380003 [Clostridium neonatale]
MLLLLINKLLVTQFTKLLSNTILFFSTYERNIGFFSRLL